MRFSVDESRIALVESESALVSGSVGIYEAEFAFTADWTALGKVAVFRNGNTVTEMSLESGTTVTVPWEPLNDVGVLQVGVYGTSADGTTVVRPTVWCRAGSIEQGVWRSDQGGDPTPTVYEQIMSELHDLGGDGTTYARALTGSDASDSDGLHLLLGCDDAPFRYVKIHGWTTASGDSPTPSAPVTLSSTGAISLLRRGRNLLPTPEDVTDHGITLSVGDDGSWTFDGRASGGNFDQTIPVVLPVGSYAFAAHNAVGSTSVVFKLVFGDASESGYYNMGSIGTVVKSSLKALSGIRIIINRYTTISAFKMSPQVESMDTVASGKVASDYEQYASQTVDLAACGELHGIGSFSDDVSYDNDTTTWTVTRRTCAVALDGATAGKMVSSVSSSVASVALPCACAAAGKCSHFAYAASGAGTMAVSSDGMSLLLTYSDDTLTTVAAWNAWLAAQSTAGTPVSFVLVRTASAATAIEATVPRTAKGVDNVSIVHAGAATSSVELGCVRCLDIVCAPKWSGRRWAAVGDSITQVNLTSSKFYHGYISERTGIEVVNMGAISTGYSKSSSYGGTFYDRISSVPTDCDVVTIFGSINDLNGTTDETIAAALGTASDTGTTTICGCVNTTYDNLFAAFPLANLGVITPIPGKDYADLADDSNRMSLYAAAIVEICRRRGIPCLDLYRCSALRPWDTTYIGLAFSKDNTAIHPDETGHGIISTKIEDFMDMLLR